MGSLEDSKQLTTDSRDKRVDASFPWMSSSDKNEIIHRFHPDYKKAAYRPIKIGPNQGDYSVHELVDLLEGDSSVPDTLREFNPDYQTDVLVIGGGGAGAAAALTARAKGAKVILATKLRLGDANTVMAEGGMQVAVASDDSPVRHYLDALLGGHLKNDPILLKTLVEEGPGAAQWLLNLGVQFDREDGEGSLKLKGGGGTSRPRLLTCRDYTGLELMRVLKDCVINEEISILEFAPTIELLSGVDGSCVGALLKNLDNDQWMVIQAKTVILATGGIGRLHIQGFPTSNHFGATADGLVLAYRMGAKLTLADTFQYHPTGAIFPDQMAGTLVTEGIRSAGAQLINVQGERFVNELETRDAVAASIIRECEEGRGVPTPAGRTGVWLDMPLVDRINGEGTLEKRFPNMIKQFSKHDIDIRKEPVLIYPTLHYQNGGVKIDVDGESGVHNLFVAGETSGGVHGRNRLMGNSLLDIIVYGRRAGNAAASRAKQTPFLEMTMNHLKNFRQMRKEEKIQSKTVSPKLFPDYVRKNSVKSGREN